MREKKSNKRAPLFSVTHLGLLLLCLVLITGHITGGIYARYATESGGDDAGRVISFGKLTIDEPGDKNYLYLAPGATMQRQTLVSFGGSEAKTIIFLKITADGWTWVENALTCTSAKDKLSVTNEWIKLQDGVFYIELEPNQEVENKVVFANDGKFTLNQVPLTELESLEGCKITVEAIAVQANGFETVADAWKAVGGTTK